MTERTGVGHGPDTGPAKRKCICRSVHLVQEPLNVVNRPSHQRRSSLFLKPVQPTGLLRPQPTPGRLNLDRHGASVPPGQNVRDAGLRERVFSKAKTRRGMNNRPRVPHMTVVDVPQSEQGQNHVHKALLFSVQHFSFSRVESVGFGTVAVESLDHHPFDRHFLGVGPLDFFDRGFRLGRQVVGGSL